MQHGYLELKLSWELFKQAPDALAAPERRRVAEVAGKQARIERCILASPEAARVVVPAATVAQRLAEIRRRYPNTDEFTRDLERSGLQRKTLEEAVARDLRVEALLDRVAADTPPASGVDAEIYYRLHPEAFDRPEARRLRHILITFNDARGRAQASEILDLLRSTVTNAEKFAAAALKHSQCPTAMEGGQLGVVKRQQLYQELEPAAFALAEGEISAVLESPIGLHIVRCDEVFPSGLLPFAEVEAKIIERLNDKRRQEAQRNWIKSLFARQSTAQTVPAAPVA